MALMQFVLGSASCAFALCALFYGCAGAMATGRGLPSVLYGCFGVVVLQPRLCGRAVGAVGSTSACEFGWWIAYGDAALFISYRGDSSGMAQCTAFVHAVVASHINWSHFLSVRN